ncbi:hypothetical protein D3C75_813940 [compost metagenome]
MLLEGSGKGRMGAKPVFERSVDDFILRVPEVPGRQRQTPPPDIFGNGHAGDINEDALEQRSRAAGQLAHHLVIHLIRAYGQLLQVLHNRLQGFQTIHVTPPIRVL